MCVLVSVCACFGVYVCACFGVYVRVLVCMCVRVLVWMCVRVLGLQMVVCLINILRGRTGKAEVRVRVRVRVACTYSIYSQHSDERHFFECQ